MSVYILFIVAWTAHSIKQFCADTVTIRRMNKEKRDAYRNGFEAGADIAKSAGAVLQKSRYDYLGNLQAVFVPVEINADNWGGER